MACCAAFSSGAVAAAAACTILAAHCPLPTAMRSLGRFLQFCGLVILPLASFMQLNHSISVPQMMQMLAAGVCLFGIGWILTTYR